MKLGKALAVIGVLCLTLALLVSCTGGPNSVPEPVTPVTRLDVSVGTPPPEGWRWVVAEINTGADEVREAAAAHGFFWIFYVVKGSTEISMGGLTTVAFAGEGIMVPARQQHTHRDLPQSKILAFDVRSANDTPDAFHRGTRLLLSNKLELAASPGFKVRIQEITLSPGQRMPETSVADPSFVYVVEGTLTTRTGDSTATIEVAKASELALRATYGMSNDNTAAPLRFLLIAVHT